MLKGFNYPLTPTGQSTLNPSPPWHYSADFLDIEFWSESSAVTAVLPAGLDPDSAANGHGHALFYDWQFAGENEEYLDPALLKQRPIVNLLHYPQLATDKQDEPAIHQLVENGPHHLKIEQAWTGEGSLTLPVCRSEELSDLAPVRCGKGVRASMAYIVDDLKTLKDLTK